ncbi:SubName: Full=Uncharacterized protein {ECO:0000313/EMBL:CCA70869.1} [Serendipita indica DSM 11827]|uniref:F-box domain-containing protein n=1 Tax=Serendipita indica (strain DSM 11827) TaxID=1109443 RepID=G4THS4_SERID|nr:SubName: Full=Uncharacterized protein {ECO:0000313/EMBL:CCA70869.1} [Serendipita indica DSM 11827]CCA70869.1 hypothetical protein PIIN_04805 [Serendipita indica DSM 11827]
MESLPYELIREILHLSNQPLIRLEARSEFFHGLNARTSVYGHDKLDRTGFPALRLVQERFAEYRLICKAIEPIALDLLLHDVILSPTVACIASFHAFLRTKSSPWGSKPLGYIRRIMFAPHPAETKPDKYPAYSEEHAQICSIRNLCPNLATIEMFDTCTYPTAIPDWLVGVEHLAVVSSWAGWPASFLPTIVHSNPTLETLIISAETLEIHSTIHIPTLRRLEIVTKHYFDLKLITAPMLESCTLSISHLLETSLDDASVFLRRNGHVLQFLRIKQASNAALQHQSYYPTPLSHIHDLAHACPRLETIHVSDYYTCAALRRDPHPTLKTLIIDYLYHTEALRNFDTWRVNDNQFAHFSTVVLMMRSYTPQMKPAVLQIVEEDVRFFGVTTIVVEPYCLPVVISPRISKESAATRTCDQVLLAQASEHRVGLSYSYW